MNTLDLSRDPDGLLAAWRELAQRQQHLHQPQAAAMLGLREVCLVAALSGRSATRLEGEPEEILGAIAQMGKLIMAVSHHAGVLIGIAKPVRFQRTAGCLTLADDSNHLEVRADAIAHLYVLVDEHGLHGRERHLQAFDGDGNALFKLLVLYKRHAADLSAMAERFRSNEQPRCLGLPPLEQGAPVSGPSDVRPLCEELAIWAKEDTPITTQLTGGKVSLRCQTRLPKVYGAETGVLHMSHPTMKLHARLNLMGVVDHDNEVWNSRGPASELLFSRGAVLDS